MCCQVFGRVCFWVGRRLLLAVARGVVSARVDSTHESDLTDSSIQRPGLDDFCVRMQLKQRIALRYGSGVIQSLAYR